MAPNLNSKDYYEILGVPRGADEAALKKAYKKLAVKVSVFWMMSKREEPHSHCRAAVDAGTKCTHSLRQFFVS